MNEFLRRFKRIVAQVADDTGVNFRRHGLDDLIRDAGSEPRPARLAALAAVYFCTEEGQYNGSEPGLSVVLQFLAETCTSLPPIRDVTFDLLTNLNAGAKLNDLDKWAERYYAS